MLYFLVLVYFGCFQYSNICSLADKSVFCVFVYLSGKRRALKLNFANPPFKSTARFTLNPGVPFQNPHM